MGKGEAAVAQQWLPGFEPSVDPVGGRTRLRPRSTRSGQPRPPSIDKVLAGATGRVRKLLTPLRAQLLSEPGLAEQVSYDEVAQAFAPAYSLGARELLRLHLD